MWKKILIVEDEALIAMATARAIAKHDYKTQTVFNGEAAVSAVDEDPEISLVLMDIDLGRGMDGTQAAEQILENHEIPVIFLTSHSEKEMVEKVRGITRYGYVLKSSGEFVLMEAIHMAFELFESRRIVKEREELFRYIIEHNPNDIAVFDTELRYLYGSRRYLQDFNVNLDSIIGKSHYEVFPDIPPKWREVHRRALQGEVLSNDYDYYERKDGSIVYSRWECRPWYNSDSSVGGIIIYSEELNTVEPREGSVTREGPYRELFEKAPVGIFLTSSSGEALQVNWTMADILEASSPREALSFFSDLESGLYVRAEKRRELLKVLEESGRVDDFELQVKTLKGNLRWLNISARARDIQADGSFLIHGSAQDITPVKEAEERLKKEQLYLSAILHTSLDGFWVLDMEGRVVDVNEAYLAMSGYTREEFLGMSISDIDADEAPELTRERIKRILSVGSEHFQTNHRRRDGSIFTVDISASYIDSSGGRFVCFCRDVTEPLRAKNEMHNLNQELQQTLKEREFLVREINHRVKNNLQMISSLVSLKESSSGTNLSDIKGQIDAIRIVHELLYQSSDLSSISFMEYCGDLLGSIFEGFSGREVKILNTVDEIRLPAKMAIPLGLIVNEIAINAVKYAFSDSVEAVFSIDLSPDGEEEGFLFSLENNGPPFPEDIDLENPETLGLRLISALTDQIGGSLELRKSPSPRFCIRIPRSSITE